MDETKKKNEEVSQGAVYGNSSAAQSAPSDAVRKAQEMLSQQLAQKPGAYQSPWQTTLNDTMQKILNREKFSYDLNGDALWKQYQDQYVQQGRMAMMDTMGQAAQLTGGYGNTYAQQAGQQAYHGYLQNLNDKVPELYQLALSAYNREGEDLYNQFALLSDRENQAYGQYRDQVGDWQDGYDRAYGEYMDQLNYDYQVGRDQVADGQWQAEFDEAKRRYDQEWAEAHPEGGMGGSNYYSGNGDGSGDGGELDIPAMYKAFKANGVPSLELDKWLKSAIAEGLISQRDATELRNGR